MMTRLPTALFAFIAFATVSWEAVAQAPQPGTANQPPPAQSSEPQAQPSAPPQAQPPAPPQAQPSAQQQGQPSGQLQGHPLGQQEKTLSQAELEQLVAPIALYPDPLLSNVLMASTYALDVVEAKRWLDQNKSLKGKELKAAVDKQDWDNSVRELTATPPVLAMMSDKLDWTEKLGDAVFAQQQDVMDAVQRLRVRAQAEDKLKTTKEQKVVRRQQDNRDVIAIEPASRSMAYVPYYDPGVVYGAWPYPAYPPYYWPGYYYGPDPLVAGLTFAAFAVGAWAIADNWWGGGFDWGHRHIWRDGRHHHRWAARNDDRRRGDQVARNRDNRNAAQLNDRNNRRDRQANVDNRRGSNKNVSQQRASNKQVKRASASQKRVAQRSSVNRNHVRASRGGATHISNQRARASFAAPRGGGGRHVGGARMGGGGHAARGGGRRGR
jgi:hypothetical protein